jgi:hypothetical protein
MTSRTVVAPVARSAQREVVRRIPAVAHHGALVVCALVGDGSLATQRPVHRAPSAMRAWVLARVAPRALHAVVRTVVRDLVIWLTEHFAGKATARHGSTAAQDGALHLTDSAAVAHAVPTRARCAIGGASGHDQTAKSLPDDVGGGVSTWHKPSIHKVWWVIG